MQLEVIFRNGILSFPEVATLLGTNLFDTQLPQNAFEQSVNPPGPGVTARAVFQRIWTGRIYALAGANNAGWARFQVSIFDYQRSSVLAIATAITRALATWSAAATQSPPTPSAPNFVLNQWGGLEPQSMPPIYKEMLDIRIFFQDQ